MVAQSGIGYSKLSRQLLPTTRVAPRPRTIPRVQRNPPTQSRTWVGTVSVRVFTVDVRARTGTNNTRFCQG